MSDTEVNAIGKRLAALEIQVARLDERIKPMSALMWAILTGVCLIGAAQVVNMVLKFGGGP